MSLELHEAEEKFNKRLAQATPCPSSNDLLSALELALADWHKQKYNRVCINVPATLRKLGEEYGELMEAVALGDPERVAEEAVDVLFVMSHIVRHFGGIGAFNTAAKRKLLIVNERLQADSR